ncbi:DinB family protein [Paenibacillus antarcticus]|uniref:Damage-inducible protein DinB n=1 Tax=Paenibacillus antarcticus TaxID=253703 RepID=A0A168JCP7_9BACL|nr:DinB family protein [Paenibacillus antarcticus]OAB40451.1 damage-inducible protein DinB [Paenibacillus antarcticus]
MYRKVEDFILDWNESVAGTVSVFNAMSDNKLDQAIVEGHSTLGWLAWHLTNAPVFLSKFAGLEIPPVGNPAEVPTSVKIIVDAYETMDKDLSNAINNLSDEALLEEVAAFGTTTTRSQILRKVVDHQTHHRGQMTVLLRQAGLPVPGVMGPTREQH